METMLRTHLHQAVAMLGQSMDSSVERRSRQRLEDVAEHFPTFLLKLVEPWLQTDTVSQELEELLLDCANIHLYARILDDALDEGSPVHRFNLLRAQPMFWNSVQSLGARYPLLRAESLALINETVRAVSADDECPDPRYWGPKNHHVLLAPMLLSGNGAAFREASKGLSAFVAVSQAGDEWFQGVLDNPTLAGRLLDCIPEWLDEATWGPLQRHGWHAASIRLMMEGRRIVQRLSGAVGTINAAGARDVMIGS